MSRQGWIGKRPDYRPRRRTLTPEERRNEQIRDQIRHLKKADLIGNRVPPDWEWKLGDNGGIIAAFTKGEARALIKKALGLSKKKRLPKDIVIKLVEHDFLKHGVIQ